jgi:hypothetical protein
VFAAATSREPPCSSHDRAAQDVKEPFVDEARAGNAGVLAYLRRRNERGHPLCSRASEATDPYFSLGAHPDVVERIWTTLAPHTAWRLVVLGTPAVVDPEAGSVLAVAVGTSYWIRLTAPDLTVALASGASQSHRYGLDTTDFDGAEIFGPTWVFGRWDDREAAWIHATSAADRVS